MRAVAQVRPAHPRNKVTWEVNDVLNYLLTLHPIESLDLEQLTKKTIMLMAILSGQRGQTLQLLNPQFMTRKTNYFSYRIDKNIKTSRPGKHIGEIRFDAFPNDPRLCVVSYMHAYLDRTDSFRSADDTFFFVTYGHPNGEASRDSIKRWITDVLRDAGIDLTIFKAHSTRSALTSAAATAHVPLDTILRTGGWSCASTFTTFYKLPIVQKNEMQTAILKRFLKKS